MHNDFKLKFNPIQCGWRAYKWECANGTKCSYSFPTKGHPEYNDFCAEAEQRIYVHTGLVLYMAYSNSISYDLTPIILHIKYLTDSQLIKLIKPFAPPNLELK